VGAKAPVAFFAYPDKPGTLYQPGTRIHELARAEHDPVSALEALADALGARKAAAPAPRLERPGRPTGAITPEKLGALLGASLPENAIVIDESITTGRAFLASTKNAPPHDWIIGTGGSIGYGMPVALGAAVACPDRKVVCLESDGSGLYMPQSLWTHARENLDILTLVFANRSYQILRHEMQNVGATNIGPIASTLLDIGSPDIDWLSLAKGFGVAAFRANSMDELSRAVDAGIAMRGPCVIEVVL
jgi:acetolactate synthase-1/2/3 large subunit